LECDDFNLQIKDGCDDTCSIEFGWSCSGGSAAGPDTCIEICGDGYDLGEYGCDDGNLKDGDGCDQYCFIETGFYCNEGVPEYCYPRWRPVILNITISDDGHHLFIYWNTTVIIKNDIELDEDWELLITGP